MQKQMNFWHWLTIRRNKKEASFTRNELVTETELIPPQELIFVGGGDFKTIGEEFFKYFVELGNLKPNEKVLDVGCGIGRMAVPLMKYLDNRGGYEGFDIVEVGINWCRECISSRRSNFNFQVADLYNKHYNPEGKCKANEYKFPYRDETFDFVFLTSVFTHMLPEEMENYLSEIVRVLRKGGRCLITFFISNNESLQLVEDGKSTLNFIHQNGEYRVVNVDVPENAVAYNEAFILALYQKYGLKINQPINYGSWCGRTDFLSYQDIIIASK